MTDPTDGPVGPVAAPHRRFLALFTDVFWSGAIVGVLFFMGALGWRLFVRPPRPGPDFDTGLVIFLALQPLAQLAYCGGFWLLRGGDTPGGRAVAARVVSKRGGPIALRQAILRVIGIYLNTLPLGAGWFLGCFGSRRTLADRLSGTLVLDTDPVRARRWRYARQRAARPPTPLPPSAERPPAEVPPTPEAVDSRPPPLSDDGVGAAGKESVPLPELAGAWPTVRVFISSTFRDMHAERDHLVRVVFPELRQRCAGRRLHLVDVDLRWGVTEAEAEAGRVLAICLDEIERCRPFFLGILGERYGWTPPRYEVPDEPVYDWVGEFEAGHSITALEIYAGVLRNPAMSGRAFFYLRDPSFLVDVPEPQRADFLPESPEAAEKLARLKASLRARAPTFDRYPCRFDGVDAAGHVRLAGLEAFGARVLDDVWSAIAAEHPESVAAPDPLARERAYHEAFLENRVSRFVGRHHLLTTLAAYADAPGSSPLIVTGQPGSGKSALLAAFAASYTATHPDVFVLPHFVGVSPGSTDIRRTLRRLIGEIDARFALGERLPDDDTELQRLFSFVLGRAGEKARLVLVLDALDQLDDTRRARTLSWLPDRLPTGVSLIVSALDGDVLEALRQLQPRPPELEVEPLLADDRRELVRRTLGDFRKRLDERPGHDQMALLLRQPATGNPLYLSVACEELRVFPDFERISARIEALPPDVAGLFEQVLARLEVDHGAALVRDALSLIAVARHGLLEPELLALLRPSGEPRLVPAVWARLFRALAPYLRPAGDGEGRLDFFHRQLERAVRERYFEGEAERSAHARLAEYFRGQADTAGDASWRGNDPRGLAELPYHLSHAQSWHELETLLSDLAFVAASCLAGLTYDLVADYQDALLFINSPALREWAAFVDGESHFLARYPEATLQQALNSPAGGPSRAAEALLARPTVPATRHAFFRRLTRPHQAGRGPLLRTLVGSAGYISAVAISPDGAWVVTAAGSVATVWQLATGRALATFEGHTRGVWRIAITPDSRCAVTASDDGAVRVWELATVRQRLSYEEHGAPVGQVHLTPDGRFAVSKSDNNSVRKWEVATGRTVAALDLDLRDTVTALAVAPDGDHVLLGYQDRKLMLWSFVTGRAVATLHGHQFSTAAVAITPDGRYAVSAGSARYVGQPGDVFVWDLTTAQRVGRLPATEDPKDLVLLTGLRCAIVGDKSAWVVDLRRGKTLATLRDPDGRSWRIAASGDGRYLATAGFDGSARIWEWAHATGPGDAAGPTDSSRGPRVKFLAVSADQQRAFSGQGVGGFGAPIVRVTDLAAFQETATFRPNSRGTDSAACTPDGRYVVFGGTQWRPWDSHSFRESGSMVVTIWDFARGRAVARFRGHRHFIDAVAVTPDSRFAVSGSDDKTLILWELPRAAESERGLRRLFAGRGGPRRTFWGHEGWVTGLVVGPDGATMASSSRDGTVRVWELATGRRLALLRGPGEFGAVAITPDGRFLAAATATGTIDVWAWGSWKEVAVLAEHTRRAGALAVTADGRYLLSGSADGTVRAWAIGAWRSAAVFPVGAEVTALVTTGDGRLLYGDEHGHSHALRLETPTIE